MVQQKHIQIPNIFQILQSYFREHLPLETLKHWRNTLRTRFFRNIEVNYIKGVHNEHSQVDQDAKTTVFGFAPSTELLVQDVIHAGEIPSSIQACLGRFKIPSAYVFEMQNVELIGSYAIGFQQDGVIGETTLPPFYPPNTGITLPTLIAKKLPFPQLIETPIAHGLLNVWSHNYYHWLIDCLTRLEGVQFYEYVTGCRPKLLLPSSPKAWQLQSLQLLGYNDEDYLYWKQQRAQAKKLIVSSHRYDSINTAPPAACTWLRNSILSRLHNFASPKQIGSSRILISRRKAAGRKILNEDQVISVLAPLGFTAYTLEDMSFLEQVYLFQQAEVVIAPHGAGLTNIIFSQQLKVLELFGDPITPVFCSLAKALGFEYGFLQCESTDNKRNPTKNNITVKIAELQAMLRQMGIA